MGHRAKRNSSVGYDGNGLEEEHKIHICQGVAELKIRHETAEGTVHHSADRYGAKKTLSLG